MMICFTWLGLLPKRIDLGGRLVVPGFIDSHIHFYEWALKRRDLQLDDLGSLEELLARIERTSTFPCVRSVDHGPGVERD